jgi:hypothetical protein
VRFGLAVIVGGQDRLKALDQAQAAEVHLDFPRQAPETMPTARARPIADHAARPGGSTGRRVTTRW